MDNIQKADRIVKIPVTINGQHLSKIYLRQILEYYQLIEKSYSKNTNFVS
ncbi:hypothetical protein LGAA44_230003 [Leuconostoc gasicomitatum]|nr:hypothetical protein LGAA44_230003 [Leuconostoc gasicomitatum]